MKLVLLLLALGRPVPERLLGPASPGGPWIAPDFPLSWPALRPSRPPPLPGPLAGIEEARYRVGFGPFSSVAEIRIAIAGTRVEQGRQLVRAEGDGEGALLGLGRMGRRVESDFDPRALAPRRWIMVRRADDEVVSTAADQPGVGRLSIERRDAPPGRAERRSVPYDDWAFDPIAFLLRLRVAPPRPGAREVMRVLDGSRLWSVTIQGAGREPLPGTPGTRALRFEGRAEPCAIDGRPDPHGDRPARTFVLWLSDDGVRLPLRVSVPIGPMHAVVELVELHRSPRAGR